jgi:hypothetical protein
MANFNILDHLNRLTLDGGSQGKNEHSYQCPVCGAPNFKVTIAGPKEGQYFTRGCGCMDTEAGKQSIIDAISPRWEKPARAKSSQTFTYETLNDTTPLPLVQVRRSDDGNGKRSFSQWHKADGQWVSGFPEELRKDVHLYRIFDDINKKAIANSEFVLLVEGEGNVNDLHKLGIAATCSIGGAGKWTDYGYPNYLKDLEGAVVVICPDRDVPGIKHAELIAKDFPNAPWLYANPTSFMWDRIPENKGFDLGDWIEDGATKEQILGAIEPRRIPKAEQPKPKTTKKEQLKFDDDGEELDRAEVEEFQRIQESRFNVAELLPTLAPAFNSVGRSFNLPSEICLGAILPIAASLIPAKSRLLISRATNFKVPPILWTCYVAGSGAAKSPILRTFKRALDKLQADAYQSYIFQKENYETDLEDYSNTVKENRGEKPKPPKMKHFYVGDFTRESLVEITGSQPDHGLTIVMDEFVGFMQTLDQYRGGKGGDRAWWLSAYDGEALSSVRKGSDPLYSPRSSLSLTGTIQPSVLKREMGDSTEVDGFWSRILWILIPETRMPAPDEAQSSDISEWLEKTYYRLSQFEAQTFTLSPRARSIWTQWHNEIERLKRDSFSESLKAIYPKAREQAARVALIVHNLESASKGEAGPAAEISAETLQGAIDFVRWSINQPSLIYGDCDATEDNPEALRISRFVNSFSGQTIPWTRARAWLPRIKDLKTKKFRKPNKNECLKFFTEVVKLQYGTLSENSELFISEKLGHWVINPQDPLYKRTPDMTQLGQQWVNNGSQNLSAVGQESVSKICDPILDPRLTQLGQRQNSDTERVSGIHDPIDPISKKKDSESIPESDFLADEVGEFHYLADDE